MDRSTKCPIFQERKVPILVPAAYMPPYSIQGFKPLPEPPKPPRIPEDLRKSIEKERLDQEELLPLIEFSKTLPIEALKTILFNHYCKPCKAKGSNYECEEPKVKKLATEPPPGISKVFWKLKQEKFARPPSRSKFRTTRYLVDENQEPKPASAFPLYESPSCYENPKWTFKPERVEFQPSEYQKRRILRQWASSIKGNLEDLNRSHEEWARRSNDLNGFVPENRVNFGCERIRELAAINANIVFLLVKKFVTGPPHKDLHWLNRTEAVECWERIVGEDKTIKDCCVEEPITPHSRSAIPSLKTPKKKKPETLVDKVSSKSKSKLMIKSKASIQAKKGPKVPPFCKPIPKPELRLPWHISPLRPRDGDERRKKIVFDRNIELDFIIKPSTDPYGEDRRKQRDARTKAYRQAMTNDFFKRTDMDSGITELDMILSHAQQNFDGTPGARRDLMLAQILAKDDVNNTAETQRQKDAETERQERIAARNKLPDFSHVTSKYMDVGFKHKSRGVAGLL